MRHISYNRTLTHLVLFLLKEKPPKKSLEVDGFAIWLCRSKSREFRGEARL